MVRVESAVGSSESLGGDGVLVRISTAGMKHQDQGQIREGNNHLAYTSTSQFLSEGCQDQNSSRAGT